MNIILTGFSGTGKTAIGARVASLLGWQFVDIDEVVVGKANKSIARIFDEDGEAIFRDYESKTIAEQSRFSKLVIATGGGAILNDQNRECMRGSGFLVCLEATPETINFRLQQALSKERDDKAVRPLLGLKNGDAVQLIESMKRERQWAYSMSHWTVNTDYLSIEQVAQEIVRSWKRFGLFYSKLQDPQIAASVITEQSSYSIVVGSEILQQQLGDRMLATGLDGRAYVICDQNVIHPYGRMVQRSLHKAGIEAHFFIFPSGEASKSMETAQILFNWFAERQLERRDTVIGVGGGVAGDLAGFVASTYLRGLRYVHVPTSMVAMIDSSIGGKTAVDLASGKNLIGSFHAPSLVLSDIATLNTLPKRALAEGYAEAIKHGLIMDPTLVEIYDSKTDDLLRLEPDVTTEVVARNVRLKATVVTEDEKETSGLRTILNYGHTIGHGIEAAAGFDSYLHGEAVAIGMIGASRLGNKMGITPEYLISLQQDLLRKFGLPDRAEGVTRGQVLAAMTRDKKNELGQVNWVFLEAVGSARTYRGVPLDDIGRTLFDLGIN